MCDEIVDKRYTIGDEEELLRLLSFPSCFNVDGTITSEAFSLYRKNEDYVSLNRLLYSNYKEAIKLGRQIKLWLTPDDEFCGYAQLNAKEIRAISKTHISLESKYREDFKGHAGISYIDGEGKKYVCRKNSVEPPWILCLQQALCKISNVKKINGKNHELFISQD